MIKKSIIRSGFDAVTKAKQPVGGEIRKHYFLDRYVIIAPRRAKRPDAFGGNTEPHKTETEDSPALDKERAISQIKDRNGQWMIKVVANKFPALTLDSTRAFGKQEVVVECPEHNTEFSELSLSHIEKILAVFVERTETLQRIPGIEYVTIFKNDGPQAGATVAHAHSQIIALPLIPPSIVNEAIAFEKYRLEHGTCPYCDVIAWERRQKQRLVYEDRQIVAFCPYAASAPFSVWIAPKRHAGRLGELTQVELRSIAKSLKKLSGKLDAWGMSFNFFLQDSLPEQGHHFVIKIEPRPNTWGGLELSTGMIINPVSPEIAAGWYKSRGK